MHKIFVLQQVLFHASTCFEHHVLIISRSKLHYTASGNITLIDGLLVHEMTTYRFDDTRGCVMQFWPPDDEHMSSKHVEAWNKLIVKQTFCASSWLITEINILRCTVSKTSKFFRRFSLTFQPALLAVTCDCDVTGNINYRTPIKPRPV